MTRTTPIPAIIPDAVQTALAEPPACAAAPGSWCARFYQWTNNESLASAADAVVTPTLRIVLILVIALGVRHLLHRSITRLVAGATNGHVTKLLGRAPKRLRAGANPLVTARRAQRARTIGSVLRSITSAVVLLIAAVMILAEFGVALGPILASAGIVGVAVGFGAQNLVRDFLSGMFMLLEDQYGVGDVIDVGAAKGTVEAVTLRTTRLRDVNGVVWYVPNGEIKRVGNESQNWARVVLDVPVEYDADLDKVRALLTETAAALAVEPPWDEIIIEDPTVWGVQALSGEAIVVRVVCKTAPGQQSDVARELRERVKKAFDNAGVNVATFKQDTSAA